jgi:hypothetical protein
MTSRRRPGSTRSPSRGPRCGLSRSTRQRPRPPSVERRERFGRYCSSRQADQEQGRVPRRGVPRRAPSRRPARATSPSGTHRHDARFDRTSRATAAGMTRSSMPRMAGSGRAHLWVPGPVRKRRSHVIAGRGGVLAWHATPFAISGPGGAAWRLVGVLARSSAGSPGLDDIRRLHSTNDYLPPLEWEQRHRHDHPLPSTLAA